ncbi:Uncharacterised protein [Mycobacteroides abscessus]|uniref:DUF6011 domain-containing protein n=1 Tax=Mycobacteroides abscessus TaxID=36809 RepID=UPI0005EA2BF6|nr:DUF6011 domain-containing protein [Mycobacteroides abscessus]CPT94557.1 Uncharacterised protein [Mycobacteroides abscessus]CPW13792.1 Uncharacterised protein [Mycobacteroides abscessus]CQA08211.1 Uncharacterised protein [Mycobacteroides abscessus]
MRSPFAAPASGVDIDPIADAQRGYLRSLLLQKAQLNGKREDEASEEIDALLDRLSKSGASSRIEETKRQIAELTADGGHKAAVVRDHRIEGIEDGFYELSDGRIVKVIHAVHGSGRQYGKVLDTETRKYDIAVGILREVQATGKRIDDDQDRCAELGKLYGICMCCGLELTDEASIEAGIGPICKAKRGW